MGNKKVNLGESRGGSAFRKFVEQEWKDALNMATAELAGWGYSAYEAEKTISLPKKPGGAKVAAVKAVSSVDGKRRICRFAKIPGVKEAASPKK